MSRNCPKKYHQFLNWIRGNCNRFSFRPQLFKIGKRRIDFYLQGVNSTLKLYVEYTKSNGPWIAVDAVWPGIEREGLIRFFGAEMPTKNGWITSSELPESQRYWNTKEELWEEICFEMFLTWCNKELAEATWLEFYKFEDQMSGVSLLDNPTKTGSFIDKIKSEWERDGIILPHGENFFVLVRKEQGIR